LALKKAGGLEVFIHMNRLLGAGVFGDSFGTLRDGMLGQLTRQQETN
jgi:hypothetical protein